MAPPSTGVSQIAELTKLRQWGMSHRNQSQAEAKGTGPEAERGIHPEILNISAFVSPPLK